MMKKISILLIIILFIHTGLLFAEYNPPSGGELMYDLYSPELFSSGSPLTSAAAPLSSFNNPAAGGFLQRVTAAFNYTALNGSGLDEGWGNIINGGLAVPSDIGVYSASVLFMNSSFNSLDYGTLGKFNFAFSKDLYDNLSAGAALIFTAGSNDGSDWGLGLDLGILHYPESFLSSKNFRWGLVIKNIGKGYSPDSDFSPFPSPFTPGLGAGLTLINEDKFSFDFTGDLLLPYFQNLRGELGAVFSINNLFKVNLSSRFDLNELSDEFSPVSAVGISFGFNADLGKLGIESLKNINKEKTEVHTTLDYSRLSENLNSYSAGFRIPFGSRDDDPPLIDIDYSKVKYISPNNDGRSDDLDFPVGITDERFVKGYEFVITDTDGNPVRTYENKDERPENISFDNIFDRLLYVKKGIAVPDNFRWDGNNAERSRVEDGEYRFFINAWDDNGNKVKSSEFGVVVDTEVPELSVTPPPVLERVFSPNGDGSRDFLTIRQSGSVEDLWEGKIKDNNGQVVRTVKWENSSPADFFWNGTDDNGVLLPDGVYTYEIESTDRAENRRIESAANIIISTMSTPVAVLINRGSFSPDNNGVNDSLDFIFNVPVKRGISAWVFDILDRDGYIVNSFEGYEDIPDYFTFYGLSSDKKFLPEDSSYRGRLHIVYKNGNMPEAFSPDFEIDVTPPSVKIDSEYKVFSPNSDGRKDYMLISQDTSREDVWTGVVKDWNGDEVYRLNWFDKAESVFKWDGISGDGRITADGEYTYEIFSEDRAGNRGKSAVIRFIVDTEETPLMISREYGVFSPNKDGIKDTIRFFPELKKNNGIESYIFKISDKDGNAVYRKEGSGRIPEYFSWNGKEVSGKADAEGYRGSIEVLYINGNNPKAQAGVFSIDTEFPVLKAEADYKIFSPNSDGNKDFLSVSVLRSSDEELWKGRIRNMTGEIVREYNWKSLDKKILWDGKDSSGNILSDGEYSFEIESSDAGGNRTSAVIDRITVDNRVTSALVSVGSDGFSPNNDNYFDSNEFALYVSPLDGIEKWSLDIKNNSGESVKTFKGDKVIPSSLKWDGKDNFGNINNGVYRSELSVLYRKGDNPSSVTREFLLDTAPPESDIIISPYPFSPDNDGIDDEVEIKILLNDLSGIRKWSFSISDPAGSSFKTFKGKGKPSGRIIWDGNSGTGELVQAAEDYPFVLTAEDKLGNVHERKGIVPIDVLVIRDGDRLKIRISSMKFSPNKAQLVEDIPEVKEKNEKIINRLSEILNKYSSYNIRIEGHANNLSWADPGKAAIEEKDELIPLSDARCVTVRDILVKKGVDKERITMEGLGGTEPLVPFSDLKNRWKNRRVEFILIK